MEAPNFWVGPTLVFLSSTDRLYSFPSSSHDGGGTLSFADGHVELHKWLDARTKPPVLYTHYLANGIDTPNTAVNGDVVTNGFYTPANPDLAWLVEHCVPAALRGQ